MYLDFLVKIPDAAGKITRRQKGDSIYINYEYGREYDPERQFNIPRRATIGKQSKADAAMMQPNQNYLLYFPGTILPEEKFSSKRCSLIRIGTQIVIEKIVREYGLESILSDFFERDIGLLFDLASYSIVTEDNAGQYYPDYAYNHSLFTESMKVYSDSKVSDFLHGITPDQSVGFLNEWNAARDHKEKIYISYDSTNKNCQAGDIELAEFGHPKADIEAPVINYSIAYDTDNKLPLFYEEYPGSIVDISQLQYMIGKAKSYGYKSIGFILDRGYFCKENISYLDEAGYDFVIMVKGMAAFINELVLRHRGMFEDKRMNSIRSYHVYGMTIKQKLYVTDEKDRYFHIYHNPYIEASERDDVEDKIQRIRKFLEKHIGKPYEAGKVVEQYFSLYYSKEGVLVAFQEKEEVIERELKSCGYFVIVTSKKMSAKEAIELYKSRDESEKLFRGDKSYLGNKSLRTYSSESTSGKIFVEFIALIIRSRMYNCIKAEAARMDSRQNYMNVPAAIKELEKIEMVRGYDKVYRLDHAVTATQKTILSAFGISEEYVKQEAERISMKLKEAM